MKKNSITFILAFVSMVLIIPLDAVHAQPPKTFNTQAGSMKLSGTSTLHDWTMNGIFQVAGNFLLEEGTQKLQSISSLQFNLPVENLKSDKKKLDETAYKALKTEMHKEIRFTMTHASVKEVQRDKYAITANGNLTIAGVTKPVTMQVNWTRNQDQTINCSGVQKLRMTDYQVKPPSFMGVMKTGDEIELDFSFLIKT